MSASANYVSKADRQISAPLQPFQNSPQIGRYLKALSGLSKPATELALDFYDKGSIGRIAGEEKNCLSPV